MLAKEIREKTAKELSALLLELRREQFNLRMQQGTGQAPKPHQVRELRRKIARIKTIQNEFAAKGDSK